MHPCNAGVQFNRTHAVCTVDRLQKCYGPAAFEHSICFLGGLRLSPLSMQIPAATETPLGGRFISSRHAARSGSILRILDDDCGAFK
jgi:hypothetical protein